MCSTRLGSKTSVQEAVVSSPFRKVIKCYDYLHILTVMHNHYLLLTDLYWTNPQFSVTLDREVKVVVSLMQKGSRLRRTEMKRPNADYAIAFDVYAVCF